jgi:EmrB/QacA subfamily drug resistance transporter
MANRVTPMPAVADREGTHRRWALVLGSLTSFLVGLDALVVATALPTLHEEYGGGVDVLSWTVNAYQLAFAATILTGATLGDRFGRRRMFAVGVALFGAASMCCALSPSVDVLIAARVLQGIGGGIAVPLSLALITDSTPPQLRGRALGVWGAVTGVAVAAGPLVGGAIVEGLAWPWIFWINVPISAVIAVATVRTVREHARSTARRVDWLGLVLSTGGVLAIAQALIRADSAGWTSWSVAGGLVLGVVALVLFVVWERRVAHPMMPTAMFRSRRFTIGCITSFTLMAGVFGLGFLTAQYLQLALDYSPLQVGIRLLPATGLALLLSPLAGRLADRVGEYPLILLGLALQGIGLLAAGLLVTTGSGYERLIGPLFVVGAGIAIAFPTVATAVLRDVAPTEAAVASGIGNTFRQVGAVFGVALTASVFAGYGSYRTSADFVAGYRPAFVVLGALCLVGAAVAVTAVRRIHR